MRFFLILATFGLTSCSVFRFPPDTRQEYWAYYYQFKKIGDSTVAVFPTVGIHNMDHPHMSPFIDTVNLDYPIEKAEEDLQDALRLYDPGFLVLSRRDGSVYVPGFKKDDFVHGKLDGFYGITSLYFEDIRQWLIYELGGYQEYQEITEVREKLKNKKTVLKYKHRQGFSILDEAGNVLSQRPHLGLYLEECPVVLIYYLEEFPLDATEEEIRARWETEQHLIDYMKKYNMLLLEHFAQQAIIILTPSLIP